MGHLFDQAVRREQLHNYFRLDKSKLEEFGSKVNQTFEAFVFASVIQWYQDQQWNIEIINPLIGKKRIFKLKFNTRGRPSGYTFVRCTKDGEAIQIRHNLRV